MNGVIILELIIKYKNNCGDVNKNIGKFSCNGCPIFKTCKSKYGKYSEFVWQIGRLYLKIECARNKLRQIKIREIMK